MLEKLLRSLASAAMMMAVALPSTAVGGFEYAISGSVISAEFVGNFAELVAHPTFFGIPVNSVTLYGPGDTPALDLTTAFFGTGDALDPAPALKINQGPTETGVFSAPIPASFFPVLAGGKVGVSFLATDTDTVDSLFAIDYIGLNIVTTDGAIEVDIGGRDGFGISLSEGASLSVSSLGSTGTGFDEPISGKAHENHFIPAPATVWLVIAGLGGLAALRARLRRAAPASLLALMLAALTFSAPPARALVQELSIEEMTQQASWIVEGQVTEMYSAASTDGSQIYTFITFNITSQLKGSTSLPNSLVLRVLGGQTASDAMLIPEGPSFTLDAPRMLLFIGPNPQSPFPIVGLGQGAFILTFDSVLGEDRADNGEVSLLRSELIQRINDELGP